MIEMDYNGSSERKLLATGFYEGIPYYVISLGKHPCAYIDIGGMIKSINTEDVVCHGGITYSENYLTICEGVRLKGWFIGWDYAHSGDYVEFRYGAFKGKKYTTKEMIEDCKDTIEQILKF